MRRYTPYHIWLAELKLLERFFQTANPAIAYRCWRHRVDSKGWPRGSGGRNRSIAIAAGQMSLFDEVAGLMQGGDRDV
jgi:hypothetical protein